MALDVASQFGAWEELDVSVDEHLTDQLMIPMALAGAGSFTAPPLTEHAWTNIEVVAAFTGTRIAVRDLGGERFRLSL